MKTRNFLSAREMRILQDLLLSHKEDIEAGNWGKQNFTAFATKELKRPVTVSNIRTAVSATLVYFPAEKRSESVTKYDINTIRILARNIYEIRKDLGMELDEELNDLINMETVL